MKIEWTTSELKETILVLLAVLWGTILLLPGNTFSEPSEMDFMSHYAPDHVWGISLILVCGPLLFVNRYKHPKYRSFVHAYLWIFWLGISALAVYRSRYDGLTPTDFLLVIPFLTLALLHAVIYVGLGRRLLDDKPPSH